MAIQHPGTQNGSREGDLARPSPPSAVNLYPTTPSHPLNQVHSTRALELTGGSWLSSVEPIEPDAHEVPPDGVIELHFCSEGRLNTWGYGGRAQHCMDADAVLDLATLQEALTLTPNAAGSSAAVAAVGLSLAPCDSGAAGCVMATPITPLDTNAVYTLTLPAATAFNDAGSTLDKELTATLSGLVPFRFPFLDSSSWTPSVSYRRSKLWLRHGLHSSAALDSLAAAITLHTKTGQQPLAFELTHEDEDTLLLHAAYAPNTVYVLSVAADATIFDGFGLPLQSSEIEFQTSDLDPFFLIPGDGGYSSWRPSHARFPVTSCPAEWPLLARGTNTMCSNSYCSSSVPRAKRNAPQFVRHFDVGGGSSGSVSVQQALAALYNEDLDLCSGWNCANAVTVEAPAGLATGQMQAIAVSLPARQGGSRLVLQRAYTSVGYRYPYDAKASTTRYAGCPAKLQHRQPSSLHLTTNASTTRPGCFRAAQSVPPPLRPTTESSSCG